MSQNLRKSSFVQASWWLVLGVPAVALALLVWVEATGANTRLFYAFNGLSQYTGPAFWAHVTVLGDGLVTAVLFLPWIRQHPERVWGGILGALVMVLVLRLFKGMLSLPRPLAVLPPEAVAVIGPGHRRGAFPSGHTATFFLLVGIWALSTRKRILPVVLILPGILVGISRMAVGVHWPSDVLGGAALGWISAWAGLRWADRTPWGTGRRGQLILGVLLLVSALVLASIDHTGYPGVLLFQRVVAAACLLVGVRELFLILRPHDFAGLSHLHSGD